MHYKIIIILISVLFSESDFFYNEIPKPLKHKKNWYTVSSWVEIHDDITPSLAKENAIKDALQKIIEYHSGIEIKSTSFSFFSETNLETGIDHFSKLINSLSSGMILEKEVINIDLKEINNKFYCKVVINAKVGMLDGEKDSKFILNGELNRDKYQSGDELFIDIASTKDCFIYVFNILGDESVNAILPNDFLKDNFLKAGETLRIPSKESRLNFKVDTPDNQNNASEMILIIAIKSKNKEKQKSFDLLMGNYEMAISELMKFILNFSRNEIEQLNLPYLVYKK